MDGKSVIKKPKFASMDENQGSIFLTDDIVIEILLRLPIKTLFRFKLVSKQWESIISSDLLKARIHKKRTNSFPKSLSSNHLWGYLRRFTFRGTASVDIYDVIDPPSIYLPELMDILASSNGLALCSRVYISRRPLVHSQNLCVANPLSMESVNLPSLSLSFTATTTTAFCTRVEISTDITYKVVHFTKYTQNCGITVFSSDTGRWCDEKKVENCPEIVFNSSPLTCNAILHWFDFEGKILVTYDPYNSPDRFGGLRLPSSGPEYKIMHNSGVKVIHLGQEDVVKFGEIQDCGANDRRLIVWRLLGYDKGDWSWCAEQMCVINPLWKRSYENLYSDYFCCLGVEEEESVERCDIIQDVWPLSGKAYVPFALCPWASPCSGKDDGLQGVREVSPRWLSPHNKYRGLLDWVYNK